MNVIRPTAKCKQRTPVAVCDTPTLAEADKNIITAKRLNYDGVSSLGPDASRRQLLLLLLLLVHYENVHTTSTLHAVGSNLA